MARDNEYLREIEEDIQEYERNKDNLDDLKLGSNKSSLIKPHKPNR